MAFPETFRINYANCAKVVVDYNMIVMIAIHQILCKYVQAYRRNARTNIYIIFYAVAYIEHCFPLSMNFILLWKSVIKFPIVLVIIPLLNENFNRMTVLVLFYLGLELFNLNNTSVLKAIQGQVTYVPVVKNLTERFIIQRYMCLTMLPYVRLHEEDEIRPQDLANVEDGIVREVVGPWFLTRIKDYISDHKYAIYATLLFFGLSFLLALGQKLFAHKCTSN